MAWTKHQQAAIDQRGVDLLVSAAAGSGKTAVLTERVLQRVLGTIDEEPIDLDRFLIVTFTSAAAHEMKERINQKLSDHMEALQKEILETQNQKIYQQIVYLEKQITLLQTASISTIHSFCLRVIKTYFHQLDIDPNIKVAQEAELDILKVEILEQILEEKFEQEDKVFLKLVERYASLQTYLPLIQLILEIYTFSKSTPFPNSWLDEKVQLLTQAYQSLEDTPWSNVIKHSIQNQIQSINTLYEQAYVLCKHSNGPALYQSVIEEDLKQINTIRLEDSLEDIIAKLKQIKFSTLPRNKQECDETLKERVKEYRDFAKELIKKMQEEFLFIGDGKMLTQLPKAGQLMQSLVELIKLFEQRYQEAKKNAGIVDYHDLEHLCMKVLINPQFNQTGILETITYTDAAKELSQFYQEIYIDEYQDSNTVQEMILNALAEASPSNRPTRFMVGDMKQSIYRFRLANPLIFSNKYETWDKYSEQGKIQSQQICIDLSQNFRSRENILYGINEIFEQIMSKEVGDLEYDQYAQLRVGNLYQHDNTHDAECIKIAEDIELHLIETKETQKENQEESELEEFKAAELEAMMVAERIHRLLKGEGNPTHVYDKSLGTYRKVEARDIVILLRATQNKAAIYEKALTLRGIGAYADVNSRFFDAIEIQIAISMLKIIDNPLQDIPLITVLRSPMVGVSLDDLIIIRKSLEKGSFYEALKVYAEKDEAKLEIKAFMQQLQDYRIKSSHVTIEELIAKIYVQTGYYEYVGMLTTGTRKQANLDKFKAYANEFEIHRKGRLFHFIQYLEQLSKKSDSIGEAKLIGENENLVRIMSIHKSKGLEFGIVFLCDTAKRFNNNDLMRNVMLHSNLGLAPDFIDSEEHVKYPTIPRLALKTQLLSENISEEMRVLYVALTRAREKLIITGAIPDFKKQVKKWSLFAIREQKQILPLGVKKAGSYLNWIGMSVFNHPNFNTITENIHSQRNNPLKMQSRWSFTLWDQNDLNKELQQQREDFVYTKEFLTEWDVSKTYGEYKQEIYRRLSFKYPYEESVLLPTKLSVSEIKDKKNRDKYESAFLQVNTPKKSPQFMQEEKIQGAQRGTIIHEVFEQLDLITYTTKDRIYEELYRLIEIGKIQKEVLTVIDLEKLTQLAKSPIFERMRSSKHVWKEKQFVYLASAREIDDTFPTAEHILLQGVIDTFFLEEDGIVLIDYKTDYVDLNRLNDSIAYIQDKYSRQIQLYAKAITGITNLTVKEKYIYLYTIDRWITIK